MNRHVVLEPLADRNGGRNGMGFAFDAFCPGLSSGP